MIGNVLFVSTFKFDDRVVSSTSANIRRNICRYFPRIMNTLAGPGPVRTCQLIDPYRRAHAKNTPSIRGGPLCKAARTSFASAKRQPSSPIVLSGTWTSASSSVPFRRSSISNVTMRGFVPGVSEREFVLRAGEEVKKVQIRGSDL